LKIGPDCVPCILKMCLGFIRKSGLGDSDVNTLFNEVLQMPTLSGKNWDVTSATVVEQVMRKIYKVLGNEDPLKKQKSKLNRYLMDRYEIFEGMYGKSASFLLSKCYLYMNLLNTPLEGLILANYYDSNWC